MSSSEAPARNQGARADTVIMIVTGALVLAAIWYVLTQRQQALRNSPTGFDGLQIWLASEGVSTQSFQGGWLIDQNTIGLLVLPVYDTALDQDKSYPQSEDELLFHQDEIDLEIKPIIEKAERVPTLIVLPKWRRGMRLTGFGHPVLLANKQSVETVLGEILDNPNAKIRYASTPFTEFLYQDGLGQELHAKIYAAQMIDGAGCSPIIGRPGAMLLAECPLPNGHPRQRVLILSDPDLLNNHGLRLEQNAEIALNFMSTHAQDGNILIDYSRQFWLRDRQETQVPERTWADLVQFFAPPFLQLWLGAALAMGIVLWRSSLRYGVARFSPLAFGASKNLAIRARARLMRMSDQDGALLGEYCSARISAATETLFGPAHARHYANEGAFFNYLERHNPKLSARLMTIISNIDNLPPRIPAAEAIHYVDELEQVLEQIANDA